MHYRYLVERTARMYADQVAIRCGATTRTVGEVYDKACRLGNALRTRGITEGDRIAVLLPNCAEYLEIDVGLALAGFVRVSLNSRGPAHQHQQILEDSGARVLVYSNNVTARASDVLRPGNGVEFALQVGGDVASSDNLDYEGTLASASAAPPSVDPDPSSLYCLFYTSGTTGAPKGVMLSHEAYIAVALSLLVEFGPVSAGDSIVLPQPLSHGAGFFLLSWLMSGATSIVMERFDAVDCLELVARYRAQTLKLVPTMLLQIQAAGLSSRDLPALRNLIYGASPMPAAQLGQLVSGFGHNFMQLYGQAEAPMCITVLDGPAHRLGGRLLSSAGRPWRGVEVRVVDEEGRDVDAGIRGEVIVRGRHLMTGYWHQPELTSERLRAGYVHTRDMAVLDERGYIYLLGRTDEMIISGGFNIAPRVVEDVLNSHPQITESVVLGSAHETLGQEVVAFVTLKDHAGLTPDDIIEFARGPLGYQKPRIVRIVDRIPRNSYGKVSMRELRELLPTERRTSSDDG